jgi:O-antigen ligase
VEQAKEEEEIGTAALSERMDSFCARAILAIFIFILVWGPLAFAGKTPGSFLVIQGATVAALALWTVRFWVQRPFRLLWPPVCWAVLAFLVYALARCRLVEVEYAGRQQWIHVLVYGALFFLAMNNLNRTHSATQVSIVLVAVGFASALLAVFQFASHYQRVWGMSLDQYYWDRGSGGFLNPDHLADFLCITVPLALAYAIMGRVSAISRVLLAYAAVGMLAGVVVSVSRGGIAVAIVMLALFCAALFASKDFWKQALILLCVLTALALGAATQFDSIQKRFQAAVAHGTKGDERPLYWEGALKLFERAPLLGVGPGHFDVEFPSVRNWRVQDRPNYAHNDYLNTLCDWGILGLGIIAAACGLLVWVARQAWQGSRRSSARDSKMSDRSAFVVGASVALLAVMVHCVVEYNMHVPALAIAVITLMALLAAQVRFATERYWRNPGRHGKILLTTVSAAAIFYLTFQGARKGTEVYWRNQAMAADTPPASTLAFLAKAHEAQPMDWELDYKMGEGLWLLSLQEDPDYLDRAKQAFDWYDKTAKLNPYDGYAPVGCGMCLDRMGKVREATPFFRTAITKDPHNCQINLEVGRHCIALGELDAAWKWVQAGNRWAATAVANAESMRLYELMRDPLWVAGAKLPGAEKLPANDPLLKGPD